MEKLVQIIQECESSKSKGINVHSIHVRLSQVSALGFKHIFNTLSLTVQCQLSQVSLTRQFSS